MPAIHDIKTVLPPHRMSQEVVSEFAREHFAGKLNDVERLLPIFDHAGIQSRYFSIPVDWFSEVHSLEEKNELYIQNATRLSAEAARGLLENNGLEPHQIDYIIYVNSTGLATPSIDARLINVLNLRSNIRRTPIWGLGCAGGAAGLAHAYHYALGHPNDRVLLIAAELCGLTFMADDFSQSNFVATALFGEGAAAVLVTGDSVTEGRANGRAVEMLGTRSQFFPDSEDVMGWSVVSGGLQVVFAQRIPEIVAAHAEEDLVSFLAEFGLTLGDIEEFLLHPGGRKVIEAYEQALGFSNGHLALSREVLRDFGNMSSVTVLFVLERYLKKKDREGYSLISALGPGFCSESILVKC